MVIDTHFKSYDTYFNEILLFLENVSWLFNFPVTELLSQDIFSKIPPEWKIPLLSLTNEELNLFPTGYIENNWPPSLINFQEDCQRLTLPVLREESKDQLLISFKDIPNEIWRGMSNKKKTEVQLLSSLVHKECQTLGISKILDVGSGHGYVDRLLLIFGYKVLGIETNSKMVNYTVAQLKRTFPSSLSTNFKYVQLNINSNSFQDVNEAIRKYLIPLNQFGNEDDQRKCSDAKIQKSHSENIGNYSNNSENILMIGLHACGDLAIDSLKLFLNVPEIKSLVLVPCCYHKMLPVEGVRRPAEVNVKKYCNFPISKTLKDNLAALNGNLLLQESFLRLAGQATSSLWRNYSQEDHENHAFHVLSRAIIQLYCSQERIKIEKCFRRVIKKSDLDKRDFSLYVNETLERCNFSNTDGIIKNNEDIEQIRLKLLTLWEQHSDKLQMVEVITGLQMRIESVAESLIASDRACFLLENGIKDIQLVKLFSSSISPRGLVYTVSKTIK